MKVKLIIVALCIAFSMEVKAQDPVFTEFFFVPETLNPGFTGYTNTWHAGVLHRSQWPDDNRKINTEFGFVNKMVTDKAGLGITLLNHHEVFTDYNYFQIKGAYSYYVALSDNWGFTPGLEAGFGRKDYNFEDILLEDQIDINTGATTGSSTDPGFLDYNKKVNFFDISAGFIINSETAWFGAALKHLNRPNISFIAGETTPLDMLLTIHGAYFFELDNAPMSILPADCRILLTGNYMKQGQYNRLDIGPAFELGFFTIGALAATNPQPKSSDGHILTSINPFFSFQLGAFNFNYSYDLNTSKLGNTHGVHEIAIIWTSSHTCATCDNYKVKFKRNGVNGYQH